MRALDRAGPCLLEREQFGRWSCLPYYCRGDELSREHGKRYPIATVTHDRITPRIAWNRANGRHPIGTTAKASRPGQGGSGINAWKQTVQLDC